MSDPLPRILELLHLNDEESVRQAVELVLAFHDPFLFATILMNCRIDDGRLHLGPPLPRLPHASEGRAAALLVSAVLTLIAHAPRPDLLPPTLDPRRPMRLRLR
ncbi:MAG: hypothetical protein AAFV53_41740, partial [Myxococcota bacterium]